MFKCHACELHKLRRNIVLGVGKKSSKIMLIGEAPGKEEDAIGKPFVGPAGVVLDTLLAMANWCRDDVYITNVLKCRPPSNRDPNYDEMSACQPILMEQLGLIKPKLIVALGRIATSRMMDTNESIARLAGTVHRSKYGHEMFVTYHPAAGMYDRSKIASMVEDFEYFGRYYRAKYGGVT